MTSDKRVVFGSDSASAENLSFLSEMIEAGKIRPVIDRLLPFRKAVDAHKYAETDLKKGNMVLVVEATDD